MTKSIDVVVVRASPTEAVVQVNGQAQLTYRCPMDKAVSVNATQLISRMHPPMHAPDRVAIAAAKRAAVTAIIGKRPKT